MKNLFDIKLKVLCLLGFLFAFSCQQQDEEIAPAIEKSSLSMAEADQISKDYFADNKKSSPGTLREKTGSKSFEFEGEITEGTDAGAFLMGTLTISNLQPIGSAGYIIMGGSLTLSDDSQLAVRGLTVAKKVFLFFEDADGTVVIRGSGILNDSVYSGTFKTANGSQGLWTATPKALPTIVEIAVSDPRLSTLVAALSEADLVETLNGPGPFTVFAPTNNAFDKLGTLPEGDALTEVLLYHVASGTFDAETLLNDGKVTTLQGQDVSVKMNDKGEIILNDVVKVIIGDIHASNGIIHIIKTVLIPPVPLPTIVEIAAGDPQFSTLVSALETADLVTTLNGPGPFTVFAPTNDAFDKLEALPEGDALTNVLLYHVASGNYSAFELAKLKELMTLQGSNLYFTFNKKQELIINGKVKVIANDIQASNGVIHVIETVLLPPSQTIVEIAASNPQFSTLVSALESAGLVEALSGPGPFTVFAPTNDAFDKLSAIPGGDELTNVLLYHVASGGIKAKDLKKMSSLSTLLESDIEIEVDDQGRLILNGNTMILVKDIMATNGIIHVIDSVLLP